MALIYNRIGRRYALGRRTDPHLAAQLHNRLVGAESVLNVGAGTGSYEPGHIGVTAVEPSDAMIGQRSNSTVAVVQARAEDLPFEDASFSHCMTVLSMHHWEDRSRAFREIKRVTRERFVAITWDPESKPFWLTKDYFPEIHKIDHKTFPDLSEFDKAFPKVEMSVLEIPADCKDGFLAAYWQRPEAYLDELVRANISTFSMIRNLKEGLDRLETDLAGGEWETRNRELASTEFLDAGYRIVTVDL